MKLILSTILAINFCFTIISEAVPFHQEKVFDQVRDPFTFQDYVIQYDDYYQVNKIVYSNGQEDVYFDAHGAPINAEDFLSMTFDHRNSELPESLRAPVIPGEPNSAIIRNYWESYGSEYQVSPWAQNDYGGVSISASIPITSSYSHTGSIGANGVAVIIGKIIDLGYEFNYSSSSQTGVTISFAIPLGKRGCIYFTPIFMNYDSC